MNFACCALLAALSVFDYPSRQPAHETYKRQFTRAMAAGDAKTMLAVCKKGAQLLPDDPVWAYNLACSLARNGMKERALDALEKAVSLGWRDADAMASDDDLRPLSDERRFRQAIDEAASLAGKPVLTGPNAAHAALGEAGKPLYVGENNLLWDLEAGCFRALLELEGASAGDGGTNAGDLYLNRDAGHSLLDTSLFPGLTRIIFDDDAVSRMNTLDLPNTLFPLPVFGNCSRALVDGPYWRSHPRAMATTASPSLPLMQKFYLSNQIWVFPAVADCPPAGTNGDVFASVTPYCMATAGKSWSDQFMLKAALEASRSLPPAAKREAVARGMLAPLIQSIVRKSIRGVENEEDYLTEKAHPTAFVPGSLDMVRLKSLAAATAPDAIPPVAAIRGVAVGKTAVKPRAPELTYATLCAWAFVLRAPDTNRVFAVAAVPAPGVRHAFAVVHDPGGAARIASVRESSAKIFIDKTKMSPVKRVDVAVFAKKGDSPWGAPSFVSFAVVDPSAPYSDPVLADPPAIAPAGGKDRDGRKDAPGA